MTEEVSSSQDLGQLGVAQSAGRRVNERVRTGQPGDSVSLFHLASAGVDEDQDGLDQVGGAAWAAADLAEDAPGLELGVGSLAGSAAPGRGRS